MFEACAIDEVAERLGIELKPCKKKKGRVQKALCIREKLAERRKKGKAPM
jgi:ribosomal protein L14